MKNTTGIKAKLDAMFAPDIRVKLDKQSRIVAAIAVTTLGAKYILKNPLLGVDYDTALFASGGLTFES